MKNIYIESHNLNKTQSGFTLIELMVVVMIVAILTSIAVPNYQQYTIRNAEKQAQSKMQTLQMELEKWRSTRLTYRGFLPKKMTTDGSGNTITTFTYGDGANKIIYVPEGSDATNYTYQITLVDGDDTTNSLTASDSSADGSLLIGRSWKMFAEVTPNNSSLSRGHKMILTSTGIQCMAPHTTTGLTVASVDCGSNSEVW